MGGSPVTSWEGAEAIYTFADKPALIALFLVLERDSFILKRIRSF